MSADKLRESTVVLTLSQGRLREQVEGLVSRMNSRLVAPDPSFQKIAEVLPLAVAEMKAAEAKLQARSPDGALPPEQKALQYLQQAEEEYETQVQTRNQSGGGGGGQQAGSIAEDLADLFELEMDKMANQYETSSRAAVEPGRAAHRRAGREAQGAGPASAAGARAAAPAGRRPGGVGRRRPAARARRSRPRKRRGSSNGCRASRIVPIWPTPPGRCSRPRMRCGAPPPATTRAPPVRPRRRPSACSRRSASSRAPRPPAPSATSRTPCVRPRRSRASTPTSPATPRSSKTPGPIGCSGRR